MSIAGPVSDVAVRYHPYSNYNPDSAVHLLNSLMHFYHNEQNWVSRTRASLELALVQGPLLAQHPLDSPSASPSGASYPSTLTPPDSLSDPPPSSFCTRSSTSFNSAPSSVVSDSESLQDSDFKQEDDEQEGTLSLQIRPLSVRALTEKRKSVRSRWYKRKQHFKLHLGPLAQRMPQRQRKVQGPEPGAQLLELFGNLVDSRMQSCMRVSRMVYDANTEMMTTTSFFGC